MDEERKAAYRHLIYCLTLDLRINPPQLVVWNPSSWRKHRREMRRVKELANCFHNLAYFSAADFHGFEEDRFWKDIGAAEKLLGVECVERYKRIFDAFLRGERFVC